MAYAPRVSVRITVDPATRTVFSSFSATVTIVDFLAGRDQVSKHPDFAPTFAHVMDFTQVTTVDIEPATLRELAAMPSIFERDAVQIVVARADSAMYTLSQTYRAFAVGTGRNVRMAETLDEARALVIAFG